MRVKILNSYWSGESLETKVNDFLNELERKNQEVVEISYRPTAFSFTAMVVYK
jgi:hypothetical protein